ncbi:MAG: RHS repeat-associated core domain-containing protein, partial [Blastocatellia bacterium]
VWQGSQVIGEHDATTVYTTNPTFQVNSARVDYIYSGSRMISSRDRASSGGQWTTKYYLSDRLSARLVLSTSGTVLGRQAHLPFGVDFGESGTQEKHHFTSYERDGEAGTDYAANRQYSQIVGRFNRPDPYDGSYDLVNPQSLNRYSYVQNDPIDSVDPTGLLLGIGQAGICSNPFLGWFCHVPLIPPYAGGGGPREPAPPRLFAGFSDNEFETIVRAQNEAVDLLLGSADGVDVENDCETNLGARVFSGGRTINVNTLLRKVIDLRIKYYLDDESVWGQFDLINGAKSQNPNIVAWKNSVPGAGAFIDPPGRGIVLLSGFFGGTPGPPGRIGFDRSRAVALIHEAIHLQGIHDTDFDSNGIEGSRKLNTFIIQSCVNKRRTHSDLGIVVP